MKNPIKKRLQLRFVLLAMAALLLLQCAIVGISIWGSYRELLQKSDVLLEQLHKTPMETARYFSVTAHPGKSSIKIDKIQNVSLTQQQAGELARNAIHSGKDKGFAGVYRYHIYRTNSAVRILFLSREASLEMFYSASWQLVWVSLAGLLLMCLLLSLISGWVVRPLVENQAKQKQFISAASHQLKTPLAVICANAQLLQTEIGDNQWIDGILEQVTHLTDMTNGLVTLAKAEEFENPLISQSFDFSKMVRQVADTFVALSQNSGKQLSLESEPELTCNGNAQELRQLVTILLDNAIRYCPKGGSIHVQLTGKGKKLHFKVTNTAPDLQPGDYTQRFYRGENAVGIQGSGLGLSIAQTIVSRHKGKLEITTAKETFSVEVILR